MSVVLAILESRDMAWSDVTRAVGYVKEAEDLPAGGQFKTEHGTTATRPRSTSRWANSTSFAAPSLERTPAMSAIM